MVAMLHNKTFVLSPVLTAVSGLSAFEAVLFLSLTLLSPLSGFVGAVGCSSLSLSLTVTLKGATKKLMTIGIEVEMEGDEKTYDYIAIPYPEGYIDSETMFLFMQEDIENVSFVGFVDAEMQVFRTALEETDENDAEKESDS